MKLVKIFTRDEEIAGLEISDEYLRIALLELDKNGQIKIDTFQEEPLPKGIIENGAVRNGPALTDALKRLSVKIHPAVKYIIVSVPADAIYSRVFYFPKSVTDARLREAMKLTVGFNLPQKTEDIYLDWEKLEKEEQNCAFLAVIRKKIANAYIESLNNAGLKPVAMEFHPLGLLRICDFDPEESVLIKIPSAAGVGVFVAKNGMLKFSRSLPKKYFPDEQSIESEIARIIDWHESENGATVKVIDFKKPELIKIRHDILLPESGNPANKWLVSIGAARRGIIPRFKDTIVSLMPIGTEEAYEYQKAASFSEFIVNAIVGISIFFAIVYFGGYFLISALSQKTAQQIENLSMIPLPTDAASLEQKAKEINDLTDAAYGIVRILPRWSIVLKELRGLAGADIAITSANTSLPNNYISIAGTARTRVQLNSFKKTLEASNFFADINMPISNLEQKENIPFSLTLRIKNTSDIYISFNDEDAAKLR